MKLQRWLPCLSWAATYDRVTAGKDTLAAVIVTLMLIPQSLAYAMLAGLPPITGLYASIAPLFLYAIFSSRRTLADKSLSASMQPCKSWIRPVWRGLRSRKYPIFLV